MTYAKGKQNNLKKIIMKFDAKHLAIGAAVTIAAVLVAFKINEKLNKAKVAPLAPAKSTTTASATGL